MFVDIELNRPGKGTTTYRERLVAETPEAKVLLLEGLESKPIRHDKQLILGANAPIVWFVFPGKWHAVGRFHTSDEQLTGWYTNLCTPFTNRGKTWSATDLFLDFWQPVEGDGMWLDEKELAGAVLNGLLSTAQQTAVQRERTAISMAYAAGQWPPTITRETSLATVRNTITLGDG